MNIEQFILRLHEIGAIKFGEFTLKSGAKSPFYFDLRDMISHPELLQSIADLLVEKIRNLSFDYVSGIPYTALPIATLVADKLQKPLIYARKEEKSYGTKNLIIGQFSPGKSCLIIDDLITSGESIMETAEKYKEAGLQTRDFLVLIDRSVDGKQKLQQKNYRLHSLIHIDDILSILHQHHKINDKELQSVQSFLYQNKEGIENGKSLIHNDLTKELLNVMRVKKSNLVVSLDVDHQKEFFSILEQVAPHIAMLKTHVDILTDFDDNFVPKLQAYAQKFNFLIFEDRKFADIGHTVMLQYRKGVYKIQDWSDFVTVHSAPGEGILQGLFEGTKQKSGFLLAKMSSKGNLMNDTYTRKTFEMGGKFPQWVSGYIVHAHTSEALRRLKNKIPEGQLLLMPGVKLEKGGDTMGQQYTSVTEAIAGGADLIIVGRGIIASENPAKMAKEYQETAWDAYINLNKENK